MYHPYVGKSAVSGAQSTGEAPPVLRNLAETNRFHNYPRFRKQASKKVQSKTQSIYVVLYTRLPTPQPILPALPYTTHVMHATNQPPVRAEIHTTPRPPVATLTPHKAIPKRPPSAGATSAASTRRPMAEAQRNAGERAEPAHRPEGNQTKGRTAPQSNNSNSLCTIPRRSLSNPTHPHGGHEGQSTIFTCHMKQYSTAIDWNESLFFFCGSSTNISLCSYRTPVLLIHLMGPHTRNLR